MNTAAVHPRGTTSPFDATIIDPRTAEFEGKLARRAAERHTFASRPETGSLSLRDTIRELFS